MSKFSGVLSRFGDLVRILGAGETLLMQTLVLADADDEPLVRWHNGSYTLSHTCTSISFIFYQASVRRRSWPTQAPQSILLLFSRILSLTISYQPSNNIFQELGAST